MLVYANEPAIEVVQETTMPLTARVGATLEPPPAPAFYVDPEITTFSLPPHTTESVVPTPPPLLRNPAPAMVPPTTAALAPAAPKAPILLASAAAPPTPRQGPRIAAVLATLAVLALIASALGAFLLMG